MGSYASDQKNARFFGLKLSRTTDKELIEHLEQQPNMQEYLKKLIREDISNRTESSLIEDHNELICSACGKRYKDEILYMGDINCCPGCGAQIKRTAH